MTYSDNEQSRLRWSAIIILVVGLSAFLVHTFGLLRLDTIGVSLLVVALLPWFGKLISEISFGPLTVRLRERVEKQERRLDTLTMFMLSESCYTHLWKIKNAGSYTYHHKNEHRGVNTPFQRELYFLRDSAFIEKNGPGFLDFDDELHGQDLTKVAKPTPLGERIIELRGTPK